MSMNAPLTFRNIFNTSTSGVPASGGHGGQPSLAASHRQTGITGVCYLPLLSDLVIFCLWRQRGASGARWDHTALLSQARSKGPCSGLTGAKVFDESEDGVREQSSINATGGEMAVYPCEEALETTTSVRLTFLKRSWKYLSREVRFVSACNLWRWEKWKGSERRGTSGMRKQKHREGEVVQTWSVTGL